MPVEPRKELIDLTACVHGGLDYSELKKLGYAPEDVMDFSVNSNPLPLPQKVKDIMSKFMDDSKLTNCSTCGALVSLRYPNMIAFTTKTQGICSCT